MKRVAALVGAFFSALVVSQVSGDLGACDRAFSREDWITALRECRPPGDQGHAGAQFKLGVMYSNGQGAGRDYDEAAKWFRRAATQGHAEAQFNLGQMCYEGQGVPKDEHEALTWYRRAAEQGLAEAQFNLGVMYYKGQSVPQNDLLAYFWFTLAASQPESANRGTFVKSRDAVMRQLTPAQRASAQELARDWQPKPERPAEPSPGK